MLASDPAPAPLPRAPDLARVKVAYESYVLPCGRDAVNRLEELLERKFALVRTLASAPAPTRDAAEAALSTVQAARGRRAEILSATPVTALAAIARTAATGRLAPADLPRLAAGVKGVTADAGLDITAEIVHAAAPDRFGLWTRWVFNPARGSGVLGEFVQLPPTSLAEVQATLGEIRLELTALGFPSPTFASVDILLALTHAQRLQRATDQSLSGGGLESLLPGPYGLASMILGIRRWLTHADR